MLAIFSFIELFYRMNICVYVQCLWYEHFTRTVQIKTKAFFDQIKYHYGYSVVLEVRVIWQGGCSLSGGETKKQ